MTTASPSKTPYRDCHRCRHYQVTWDKRFPHGCRAIGFKGKRFPSAVVRQSSGTTCMLYEEKLKKCAARSKYGEK